MIALSKQPNLVLSEKFMSTKEEADLEVGKAIYLYDINVIDCVELNSRLEKLLYSVYPNVSKYEVHSLITVMVQEGKLPTPKITNNGGNFNANYYLR